MTDRAARLRRLRDRIRSLNLAPTVKLLALEALFQVEDGGEDESALERFVAEYSAEDMARTLRISGSTLTRAHQPLVDAKVFRVLDYGQGHGKRKRVQLIADTGAM